MDEEILLPLAIFIVFTLIVMLPTITMLVMEYRKRKRLSAKSSEKPYKETSPPSKGLWVIQCPACGHWYGAEVSKCGEEKTSAMSLDEIKQADKPDTSSTSSFLECPRCEAMLRLNVSIFYKKETNTQYRD